ITRLQFVLQYAVDAATDPKLTKDLRAANLLTVADEYSERMRLLALPLADGDSLGTKYREFVLLTVARETALTEYERIGVRRLYPDEALFDTEGLGAADSRPANTFEKSVQSGDPTSSLGIDHEALMGAYDSRHDASQHFVDFSQDRAVTTARDIRDAVVQRVLVEIAAVLITLVLAVVAALVIARSMALSLRRLREGAQETARVELPRAVDAVRNPDAKDKRAPAEVAAEIDDPLRMYQKDEVGMVARSFNEIHREAVKIAAEQAALRDSVAQMYINLARRSQSMVDRLIGHLDRLERGEEDPDRLAELFQLDHLATRMRRNDENLLVLAGADASRVEHESAHIGDVLRAAQSEVEHYTRVEFGTLLADSEVEAGVVNDIVHLVAELLDNATSFSPPDTAVVAEARQVGGDIHMRITDRGIGMSPQQLADVNEQLRTETSEDLSASRMMGLVVVAKLAQRHRLTVTLQDGPGRRGTIAELVLPQTILTAPGARHQYSAGAAGPRNTGTQRQLPGAEAPTPPAPTPAQGLEVPNSLFEPLKVPDGEHVEPFTPAPPSGGNGQHPDSAGPGRRTPASPPGVSFRPGDTAANGLPKRKVMEVTGELVADGATDEAPNALPSIRLDASAASPSRSETPSRPTKSPTSPGAPPAWPALPRSRTSEPAPYAPAAADETMELPIFREVESDWFKTSTPAPRRAGAPEPAGKTEKADKALPASPRKPAASRPSSTPTSPPPYGATRNSGTKAAPGPGGLPRRQSTTTVETEASRPPSRAAEKSWQTPADQGWQVAAEASRREAEDDTKAGLPRRKPGDRLVPGSVRQPEDEPPTAKLRRNPEGVRGLLSAYHRGVQRGRDGESTTNRSGKERDE
ncbi:MAG: ATP-binding protein, partial [Stackebrandtia sp.]